MKQQYYKIISFVFILLVFLFSLSSFNTVNAQSGVNNGANDNLLCDVFPFIKSLKFTASLCGETGTGGAFDAVNTGVTYLRFGFSLVFVGIIAVAIFIIIKAALNYIRSEGDNEKVEQATKSIRNVFIGIGALLVGIIGLVIILAVFQSSSGVNPLDTGDLPDLITP